MTQQPRYRRYLQFRFSTLLGLMTGIAVGFAPLKLWELWRAPSPMIAIQMAVVEVDGQALGRVDHGAAAPEGEGVGTDSDSSLIHRLQSLYERGELDIVSRPQIMTMNGQDVALEVMYSWPRSTTGTWKRVEEAIYRVTPTRQRNGLIKLDYTMGFEDPKSRQRTLASGHVEVREDEPVVIGGSTHQAPPRVDTRQRFIVLMAKNVDPSGRIAFAGRMPFSSSGPPSAASPTVSAPIARH